MPKNISRRDFLKKSAVGGVLLSGLFSRAYGGPNAEWRKQSPNEKLNIGCIGTANRAKADIDGVKSENIVALCDVDERYLETAGAQFPKAEKYRDFRKMLERKDLDAVVVATPDHIHAPAAVMALKLGMHVYCEKPLAHSVFEARTMARVALENKRVTQMGTQIHAGKNYRRVVEIIQSGAIGKVTECLVWCPKGWSGGRFIKSDKPVPANLDWDLWLGPAPLRAYQPGIHPAEWRRYWDYGNGTLGDMGCHFMDLPFWALKLRHPATIAVEGPAVNADGTGDSLSVHWTYPAREELPAVKISWFDGTAHPNLGTIPNKNGIPVTTNKDKKEQRWENGVLFIGDKGSLLADYDRYKLFPEEQFDGYTPPAPTIPDSIGHHAEWIDACKKGGSTTCNFDYSGALSEAILLGNVAYRTGKTIDWDAEQLKARGCPEADAFIQREYRKGWELQA